jgi:hypothetical protein
MKLNQSFEKIAKISTFIVAILGIVMAVLTYRHDISLRRVEIVHNLYDKFFESDVDSLYRLLDKDDTTLIVENSWEDKELDKVLTMFEKVYEYYEQGIIDDRTLSYIAYEVLTFYDHPCVIKYVAGTEVDCDTSGWSKEIRPYYGFTKLGQLFTKRYVRKIKK